MNTLLLSLFSVLLFTFGDLYASEKSSNTFLFCLKPNQDRLQISLHRGELSVGIDELDEFFHLYKVCLIDLEKKAR